MDKRKVAVGKGDWVAVRAKREAAGSRESELAKKLKRIAKTRERGCSIDAVFFASDYGSF